MIYFITGSFGVLNFYTMQFSVGNALSASRTNRITKIAVKPVKYVLNNNMDYDI